MTKTIHKIAWENAHYLWDDFKLGSDYAQYLLDEYGITVEVNGRVRWDKVFTVEVVVEGIINGSGGGIEEEPKKEKRKIKLIFMCGEDGKYEETKDVNDNISVALISDIRNKIEETLKTKISLTNVQIIKG
jgi:hypothetical protein